MKTMGETENSLPLRHSSKSVTMREWKAIPLKNPETFNIHLENCEHRTDIGCWVELDAIVQNIEFNFPKHRIRER
jgi:hypothetical protein